MSDTKSEMKGAQILQAIRNSLGDARSTVQELAQVFTDNVRSLRVEESESVLLQLTQNIRDLQYVMEFIRELSEGLRYCDTVNVPADPITDNDSGIRLFREMNAAFETKDWIMLSDLVEYELSPLLLKEDEWLGSLDTKLTGCVA